MAEFKRDFSGKRPRNDDRRSRTPDRDEGKREFRRKGFKEFDPAEGRSSRGFDRDDRSRSRGSSLELFDVVCARCGKETQIPFKPTGSRPVYCRDCFSKGDESSSSSRSFSNDRSSGPSTELLHDINDKLDKIIRHLKL